MIHSVLNPPHLRWMPLLHFIFFYFLSIIVTLGIAREITFHLILIAIIPAILIVGMMLLFEPVLIITDKHFLVQSWLKYLLKINSGKIYPKQFINSKNLHRVQRGGIFLELASPTVHNKPAKSFQLFMPAGRNGVNFSSLVGRNYLKKQIDEIEKMQNNWM